VPILTKNTRLAASVYLLYWYKSTNTDAEGAAAASNARAIQDMSATYFTRSQWLAVATGTQFSCFTGTKVQILTLRGGLRTRGSVAAEAGAGAGAQFTCLTGTIVQILTR
jgi:hypothetical protein